MDSPVDLQVEDGVAIVTLNRPDKRNALSEHTMRQLEAALRRAAAEPRVRVLVVTGRGEAFCAGGDLGDIDDLDDTLGLARRHETFLSTARTLADLRVPTIAAVNGSAVGAGLALALLCDLVVVEHSVRLRPGFLGVGLPPDLYSAVSLQARVGSTVAADLLLGGNTVDADEAVAFRLVNAAVTDALSWALTRARELANCSSHAVEQTIRLLRSTRPDTTVTTATEAMAVAMAVRTEEFKQATAKYR